MMLWLLPLLPIGVALALVAMGARRTLDSRTALAAVAVAGELLLLALGLWASVARPAAGWPWGPVLTPVLAVAGLGRVMIVLVPAIAAPVVLYAASSERGVPGLPRLLGLLVAFTGAMELLVLAGDLLTLLVGWELVGACSWALIAHEWRDPERPRAARDAFLTTRAGDLGLYLAVAAAFAGTGSLRFRDLGLLHGVHLHVVAAGLVLAAAAKSAQLPFSPWLYRAMAGPTPASALLHSATMVAAGAYALARLAPLLAGASWLPGTLVALGLATAFAGGVVASVQRDLKKALAASTSAQYGLMLVAIGAGVPAAAGVHLVTHAAFKALLFLGAGIALHATGTLDLGALALGRALRRTAVLFWIGALALAAVPPLGGAYSKEQIVAAAERAGVWVAAGVIVAGALGALYAGRLALLAYGPPRTERPGGHSTLSGPWSPWSETVPLAILAAFTIALGVLWIPGIGEFAARWMQGVPANGATLLAIVALGSVGVAAALVWWLWRRGLLLTLGIPEPVRTWIEDWFALPTLARAAVVRPTLALARALAALDEQVVDAGVRGAARTGRALSRGFAWWGERGLDGIVRAVAALGTAVARVSSVADDRGIDAAVEDVARGIGVAGEGSRRLQTGLAHQYYVIVALGTIAIVAAAAVWAR
ncbi:MAG: NADH-quinone oxidoreductase subunit L [Gemmatimonadota bacterium]|nr:NADH-quinone oxidoreductase subunit L [Gemmatimonadota bacterium]